MSREGFAGFSCGRTLGAGLLVVLAAACSGVPAPDTVPLPERTGPPPPRVSLPETQLSAPGDRFGAVSVQDMQVLRSQRFVAPATARPGILNDEWEFLGPGNYGGKVMDLAVHPQNEDVVWAAYTSGGLWKTTDGGDHWTQMTDRERHNYVSSVVVWEADPSYVYVGLGAPGFNLQFERGVLRSRDGGTTWEAIGPDHPKANAIYRIVLDPADPQRIFVATESAVLRTLDGGASWKVVLEYEGDNWWNWLPDFIADRNDPDTLWVSGEFGIFETSDGGETWLRSDQGIPDGKAILLAQEPASGHLFAMRELDPWPAMGFYRSTDGGATWSLLSNDLSYFHQGRYDLSFAIDPGDPKHILVGNVALLESKNGGTSFTNRFWSAGNKPGNTPHADHLRIVFAPSNPSVVYSGNDGGVWKSLNGGQTWTKVDIGVRTNLAFNMAVHLDSDRIFLTSGDWGDGQRYAGSTQWQDFFGYEWQFYYLDPRDPDWVYTSNGGSRLSRVFDDGGFGVGTSIDPCPGGNSPYARPFQFDPRDPQTIYATCNHVFKSVNRGSSWTAISPDLGEIFILAVAPSDGDRIYAWASDKLWTTGDGGANWTTIPGVPAYPQAITVDPDDPEVFYLGAVWDFWKFTGTGGSHVNVRGNLPDSPVRRVIIDPSDKTLIVSNDIGVFLSFDDGGSWYRVGQGLPRVLYWDLALDGTTILAAGQQGVWAYDLALDPCEADDHTACLLDGRFQVEGMMRNFKNPPQEFPLAVMSFPQGRAESNQAVFVESFTAGNFEAGVKMVDGCGLAEDHPQRAYWLFVGGLTNADTRLRIEDTVSGAFVDWTNPPGSFPTTVGLTEAFACSDGTPDCTPGDGTACLLGGRFSVSGSMFNFATPAAEFPVRVMGFPGGRAETRQAVFFESFNPGNFEVGVKMVDACGLAANNPLRAVWAFYGGLTNADTEVRITQISTGLVDEWTNAPGQFPQSAGNTKAFPCD